MNNYYNTNAIWGTVQGNVTKQRVKLLEILDQYVYSCVIIHLIITIEWIQKLKLHFIDM